MNLRLAKIGRGGSQAAEEIRLMFVEKAHAASEAASGLMVGGTLAGLVARYRFHVDENRARLLRIVAASEKEERHDAGDGAVNAQPRQIGLP